ncbi:hypothetical protein O181_014715 [Austropuccinia psidii MF-1]|uniref:Uncharacterized protein n=1 Tax=Austropuccinia psidii MF-1 TaxID=1389203 RepID=A0A9Q3GQ71_9BASI|nr:hypothetical protein [Austropuccinia psidii MF-1]
MFKDRPMLEAHLLNFRCPISRIINQGVVERRRRIVDFPTNPYGEEVTVVGHKIGQLQSSSPSHPPPRTFQSQIIPSAPRNFQPILATVPSSFHQPPPNPSTARSLALASQMRPSPIPPPTIFQPMASTSNHSIA